MAGRLAGQGDLILANHKDVQCGDAFARQTADAVQAVMGNRFTALHNDSIRLAAALVFGGANLLANAQTLGEEYTNLARVSIKSGRLASLWENGLALLWVGVLPVLADKFPALLSRLAASNEVPRILQRPLDRLRGIVRAWWPTLRRATGVALQWHLVAFYMTGMYYQLAHRAVGIRHVVVSGPPGPPPPSYKVLGVMLGFQLGLTGVTAAWSSAWAWYHAWRARRAQQQIVASGEVAEQDTASPALLVPGDELDSDDDEDVPEDLKCILCLSRRRNTTATPCGHLLCWDCAVEWCTAKPECPACRQEAQPHKLVRLYNYE